VPLLRRPIAAALAATVATVGLAACSKNDDDDGRAASTTTSSTALAAPPSIAIQITGVDPNGTQAPDEATVAGVKAALDAWLSAAVVAPLFSGQPAGDLSAAFTPAALERIAADPAARSTLVTEGLPPASSSITAERASAALSSVAGPDGVVAVVGASLDVLLRATGPTVDVDVNHFGEVVLVPDDAGAWKIDAFSVTTKQDSRA
jgi:hypothetical protein